jgi:hypothetical protein
MFVDEDHIPFDKDFLKKKIRSEGGVVLDKIDKHSKVISYWIKLINIQRYSHTGQN